MMILSFFKALRQKRLAPSIHRKISGAIHPDKHAARPQALRDLVNDEMSLINQLKERIFSLNKGAW